MAIMDIFDFFSIFFNLVQRTTPWDYIYADGSLTDEFGKLAGKKDKSSHVRFYTALIHLHIISSDKNIK